MYETWYSLSLGVSCQNCLYLALVCKSSLNQIELRGDLSHNLTRWKAKVEGG